MFVAVHFLHVFFSFVPNLLKVSLELRLLFSFDLCMFAKDS